MHSLRHIVFLLLVCAAASLPASAAGPTDAARGASTYDITVSAGWNLLCVPVAAFDSTTAGLFPSAVSQAFAFSASYVPRDTLTPGIGYWMKFDHAQTISFAADSLFGLSIPLKAGWNMIGGFSVPMPTANAK